jgi:hypothetical protein
MTKQPEALRIADALTTPYTEINREAANELRRLHEVNAELLGLVKLVHGSFAGGLVMTLSDQDVEDFKNAITKAEQTE